MKRTFASIPGEWVEKAEYDRIVDECEKLREALNMIRKQRQTDLMTDRIVGRWLRKNSPEIYDYTLDRIRVSKMKKPQSDGDQSSE